MAQLVLGMGMSHSTMVILDDSLWGEWAAQDATFAILFDTEGQREANSHWPFVAPALSWEREATSAFHFASR